MVSMKFNSRGTTEAIAFFEEKRRAPIKYLEALDTELSKTLLKSKGLTHVITGRLKASGRANSDWNAVTSTWTGTITFGGQQFGVDYAVFEKERDIAWSPKHGAVVNHNFMAPVYESEINFEEVMLSAKFMNGGW